MQQWYCQSENSVANCTLMSPWNVWHNQGYFGPQRTKMGWSHTGHCLAFKYWLRLLSVWCAASQWPY